MLRLARHQKSTCRKSSTRRRGARLETLEDRRLLAADLGLPQLPTITEYDVATGFSRSYSASPDDPLLTWDQGARTEGFQGLIDLLEIGTPGGPYGTGDADLEIDADGHPFGETIFGTDGRSRVNNTTSYPWRTVGLIYSRYDSGNSWCSGAVLGPFHVLTAAHCIRTATTDTPASTFANSMDFVAGSNGERWSTSVYPDNGTQSTDRPYGTARATYFRAYTWNNSSWDYDIALVTLDRRLGNFTGWMGYGWNSSNSFFDGMSMNSSGYPGDRNDTNNDGVRDTQYQFHSFDPVTSVTTHQLRSNQLDIMPGNSGGPIWRYVASSDTRTIYGVASHHNASYNAWTRITESKYEDLILDGMAADQNDRPPTDRADLVDWDAWYGSTLASMSRTTVRPGESFSVTAYTRNNGTATAGGHTVSFYASTNTTITTSDHFLGSVSMGSLGPFNWDTAALSLSQFPDSVPVGNYYIGWRIDSGGAVTEFLEGNNTGYIPGNRLLVAKALPDSWTGTVESDAYFFNHASGELVNDTLGQDAFVNSLGDIDSYYFASDRSGLFTIDVGDFGNAVDPMLAVYNAATGAKLGWDQNSGPGDDARLTINLNSWTRYILAVADFSGQNTGDLSVRIQAPSTTTGVLIPLDSSGSGSNTINEINVPEDTDFFYFNAPGNAAGDLEVRLDAGSRSVDPVLVVWDGAGNILARRNASGLGGSELAQITGVAPGDAFRVSVLSARYASSGAFDLFVDFSTTLAGDFDLDGGYSCADVDALVDQIARGTHLARFDLTGDSLVNMDDLDAWLAIAGTADPAVGAPYRYGDANLDGVVDVSDFNVWNANKFAAPGGPVPGWCQANFNADRVVDVSDFNIWNANKFDLPASSLSHRHAVIVTLAAVQPPEATLVAPQSTVVDRVWAESSAIGATDNARWATPLAAERSQPRGRWTEAAEARRPAAADAVEVVLASTDSDDVWRREI